MKPVKKKQTQRYLKKLTNNTVWSYTPTKASKHGFVEITEVEALWLQGKGPEPDFNKMAKVAKIAPKIVDQLSEFSAEEVDQAQVMLQHILNKRAAEETSELAVVAPEVPEASPPEKDVEITPEVSGCDSQEEEDVVEDIKDDTLANDPEMQVGEGSMSKPLSQMNKGELEAYAQVYCQTYLDPGQMTKKEMREEIEKIEEAKKAA